MKVIYEITGDQRLLAYQDQSSPINEAEYLSQVACYPAPLKENSLAMVNPKLAEQWNYEKNGTLTPYDVAPNSGHKVWWKCGVGHESWRAIISNRNDKGHNCPECYNERRRNRYKKKADYQIKLDIQATPTLS